MSQEARADRQKKTNKKIWMVAAATAAVVYLCFVNLTHLGIPCVFRTVTGLKCPGCGITTMCAALLRGDLHQAFHANPFLLTTLPVFGTVYLLVRLFRPQGRGKRMAVQAFYAGYLILLIGFGILRNL